MLSGSLSQNYDAVIGSLPKGLSTDERLRIRQSAPMSPAMGALQELPQVGALYFTLPSLLPLGSLHYYPLDPLNVGFKLEPCVCALCS